MREQAVIVPNLYDVRVQAKDVSNCERTDGDNDLAVGKWQISKLAECLDGSLEFMQPTGPVETKTSCLSLVE
jgi:hypothetical protein